MRPPLTLALLLALGSAARAGDDPEPREIGIPREGFSVKVPAGWSIDQYAGPLLRLEKSGARVDIVTAPTSADGAAKRPDGSWIRLEQSSPPQVPPATVQELKGIVGSLDLTPFPLSETHVDWNRGWTMRVPKTWALKPEHGHPRFVSPDGTCVLGVDAWDDLPLARNHRGIQGLDQWVDVGVRSVLEEKIGGQAIVENDPPDVAEVGVGSGIDGRLAGFRIRTAEQKQKGDNGFASVLVTDRFRLMLLTTKEGSPTSKEGFEAFRTFELDTTDASRHAKPEAGAPVDSFDKPDAPAVAFAAPRRWTKVTPKSPARLAQWTLPGDPPGEVAVFWFGAGGGGGAQANVERWKGQVPGGESTTQEIQVAEGIKATVLDAKGTYDAETMPGSGKRTTIPNARLLAAVIECPGGPLMVKAYGPRAAVDPAADEFVGWIRSFRKKP